MMRDIEPGRPLAPEAGDEAGRPRHAHFPGLISRGLYLTPVFISLSLCGCATVRYQRVYCLTQAQFEQLKASQPPKVRSQLTGDAAKDVGILAGSAIRLRAHDDGLLEVLGGCVDPN